MYEVRGTLWDCGRPVPMVLELSQWSDTESEIGLSPRCLSWPVGSERYQRHVKSLLEGLALELTSGAQVLETPRPPLPTPFPTGATSSFLQLGGWRSSRETRGHASRVPSVSRAGASKGEVIL